MRLYREYVGVIWGSFRLYIRVVMKGIMIGYKECRVELFWVVIF